MVNPDAPRGILGGPGARPEPEAEEDAFEALDDFDLDDFLAGFPESRQVYVFRREKGSSKFLDGVDVEGFDLRQMRDIFGGGKFQLRLKDPQGRWLPGSRTVEIEGPRKVYARDAEAERDDDDDDDAFEEIRRQVGDLAGLVGRLIEARQQPNPGGDRLDDMLKMARLMKELRPDPTPAPASNGDPIATFLQGLEIGRELSSGGGGLGSLAERLALPLVDLMQSNRNTPPGLPQAPAAAAPGPALDPSKIPNPPPRWAQFLPPMLPDLAAWAEAGKDPELCADWIVDSIPPGYHTPILAEVSRPELLREIAAAFEPARLFPEWFGAFLERVRAVLAEPTDDEGVQAASTN